jgi:small nuclear ribonucleoprotein (snRNP)-like protein
MIQRAAQYMASVDQAVTHDPIQMIVQRVRKGPLMLLRRAYQTSCQVDVLTRHARGIRGIIRAEVHGFDKFMNLLLADVEEWFAHRVEVVRIRPKPTFLTTAPTSPTLNRVHSHTCGTANSTVNMGRQAQAAGGIFVVHDRSPGSDATKALCGSRTDDTRRPELTSDGPEKAGTASPLTASDCCPANGMDAQKQREKGAACEACLSSGQHRTKAVDHKHRAGMCQSVSGLDKGSQMVHGNAKGELVGSFAEQHEHRNLSRCSSVQPNASKCKIGVQTCGRVAPETTGSEASSHQADDRHSPGLRRASLEPQHQAGMDQEGSSSSMLRTDTDESLRTQTRRGWRQVLRKRKLARVLLRGDQIVLISLAKGPVRLPGCLAHLEPAGLDVT